MTALITAILMASQFFCTTDMNSPYYPLYIGIWAVSLYKGIAEPVDYLGQFKGRPQSF
jgi:hypothetical protein